MSLATSRRAMMVCSLALCSFIGCGAVSASHSSVGKNTPASAPDSPFDGWVSYESATKDMFARFPTSPETEQGYKLTPLPGIFSAKGYPKEAVLHYWQEHHLPGASWKNDSLQLEITRLFHEDGEPFSAQDADYIAQGIAGKFAKIRRKEVLFGTRLLVEGKYPKTGKPIAAVIRTLGQAIYVATASGNLDARAAHFLDTVRFRPTMERVLMRTAPYSVAVLEQSVILPLPRTGRLPPTATSTLAFIRTKPRYSTSVLAIRREPAPADEILDILQTDMSKGAAGARFRRFRYGGKWPALDVKREAKPGQPLHSWRRIVMLPAHRVILFVEGPTKEEAFGPWSKAFMDSLQPVFENPEVLPRATDGGAAEEPEPPSEG